MRRGGRGGGGLYGNFVSASEGVNNKAYRGAEIPPPPCLNAPNTGPGVRGSAPPRLGPNTPLPGHAPAQQGGALPPPGRLTTSYICEIAMRHFLGLIYAPRPVGLSKHGYSTMSSIADSSLSYSQYGVSIKRARTEEEYWASDDEEEKKGSRSAAEVESGGYQPAPGSPGQEEEDDPLDAYMKELETEAVSKGSSAGSCVTCW